MPTQVCYLPQNHMHQPHVQPMQSTESESKFQAASLWLILWHARTKNVIINWLPNQVKCPKEWRQKIENHMLTTMKTPPTKHKQEKALTYQWLKTGHYTNIAIETECWTDIWYLQSNTEFFSNNAKVFIWISQNKLDNLFYASFEIESFLDNLMKYSSFLNPARRMSMVKGIRETLKRKWGVM